MSFLLEYPTNLCASIQQINQSKSRTVQSGTGPSGRRAVGRLRWRKASHRRRVEGARRTSQRSASRSMCARRAHSARHRPPRVPHRIACVREKGFKEKLRKKAEGRKLFDCIR